MLESDSWDQCLSFKAFVQLTQEIWVPLKEMLDRWQYSSQACKGFFFCLFGLGLLEDLCWEWFGVPRVWRTSVSHACHEHRIHVLIPRPLNISERVAYYYWRQDWVIVYKWTVNEKSTLRNLKCLEIWLYPYPWRISVFKLVLLLWCQIEIKKSALPTTTWF